MIVAPCMKYLILECAQMSNRNVQSLGKFFVNCIQICTGPGIIIDINKHQRFILLRTLPPK